MGRPIQTLDLDLTAWSGILGSISIACWVVVFSPQIIENFRRSSAEGLSVVFIILWLVGDVFNIAGAVLQKVLPTMIVLAVYYTLADLVLLVQCFYYRGFTLEDEVREQQREPTESTSLLSPQNSNGSHSQNTPNILFPPESRRSSSPSFRERLSSLDGTHLSPATPLHKDRDESLLSGKASGSNRSIAQSIFFNLTAICVVCAAGVLGWYLSDIGSREENRAIQDDSNADSTLNFNVLGQVFGYICATLYLGSRIPQLLLNYRRKSTDGVSMLFFIFACLGNLTYVLSILLYEPLCMQLKRECRMGEAHAMYARYFLVNLSWLLGSFGTLLLDLGVFVQYFMYKKRDGGPQGS